MANQPSQRMTMALIHHTAEARLGSLQHRQLWSRYSISPIES